MFLRTRYFIVFCLFYFAFNQTKAAQVTTAGSGSWKDSSTWVVGAVHRVPTCGDTVTILTGDTVTVDQQNDLKSVCNTAPSALYIIVDSGAVFQFVNGDKLTLPCGSTVVLLNKAVLKKATSGGGMSTFIDICGTTEWDAGDGTIIGPAFYHDGSGLPVLWLSANAVVENKNVDVFWSTATEINNNYFTVEKTADGFNFTIVGMQDGAGSSTMIHNYMLVDYSPFQGISYYRVKQTDYDGKNSYSGLVPVNFNNDKEDEIKFFPNPATDKLFVIGSSLFKGAIRIMIYNIVGEKVYDTVINVAKSQFEAAINISALTNGIYSVQLISDQGTHFTKMVKE